MEKWQVRLGELSAHDGWTYGTYERRFSSLFAQTSPYFPPVLSFSTQGSTILPPYCLSFPRSAISRFLAPNNIWQLFDPISSCSETTAVKAACYLYHINNACYSYRFIQPRCIVLGISLRRSSAIIVRKE